jgi:hypothetical protein
MCVASNYLLLGFVYCCWVPGVSVELYRFWRVPVLYRLAVEFLCQTEAVGVGGT